MAHTPRGPAAGPTAAREGETARAPVDAAETLATIRALARHRLSGSAGADRIEAELRRRFEDVGCRTRELPFSFSTLPGRYGVPFAGLVLAATGAAAWLLAVELAGPALAALLIGLGVATLPLAFLEPALRRLPWDRVETANLLFLRDQPRWIVMAHRDSKSQPTSTLARSAALAAAAGAWAALAVLAVFGLAGGAPQPSWAWAAGGVLTVAGAVLGLSPAGNASPGALDNATGLAALLAVAVRTAPDVGFLVTDGEELGLAGARAAVDALPEVAGIINLDGLDDDGPIRIAETRAGRRGASAGAVAAALEGEARELGMPVVRRPLPPFVLVDHGPLAAAGLPALTILKGRARSLRRVHRPGDSADRLTGAGAAAVATLVATVLGRLAVGASDTLRVDEPSGHSPAT